ncbi:MAG: peptidoglycan-binding protein [Chthoniobacteraceae bacterium]
MMNRLFLSSFATILVSVATITRADDFSGGLGGNRHEVYTYRDYNHYRFRCSPSGCYAISPSSAAYRYNNNSASSSTDLRRVQAALHERGYYHGEIDGAIGPASRAAIRSYQTDRNLPVSGTVDDSLLRSLALPQK